MKLLDILALNNEPLLFLMHNGLRSFPKRFHLMLNTFNFRR